MWESVYLKKCRFKTLGLIFKILKFQPSHKAFKRSKDRRLLRSLLWNIFKDLFSSFEYGYLQCFFRFLKMNVTVILQTFQTAQRPWPSLAVSWPFHGCFWAFLGHKKVSNGRKCSYKRSRIRWKVVTLNGQERIRAGTQKRFRTNRGKRSRSRFKNERNTVV
jgi:hypothetical protein